MLWIKRNLFLAIGGLVALALLGGGGYYVYSGISENSQLKGEVEATRSRLSSLYGLDPFPHTTNVTAAKNESTKLRSAITKSQKYFTPVPVERMDRLKFLTVRDQTLSELRRQAAQLNVKLPSADNSYAFSFETQRRKTDFGPGTFPTGVAEQLMEVKALCGNLFDARINQIVNIRRARVSEDDRRSSYGGDYLDRVLENVTIGGVQAESHPYELTFLCFSTELATVLNGLERSPHGFVTKAVMVEPEDGRMADAGGQDMAGTTPPPPGPRPLPNRTRQGVGGRPPPPPPAGVKPAANDRPLHLLKEKRLKVTMLVYAIKPAPSSGR